MSSSKNRDGPAKVEKKFLYGQRLIEGVFNNLVNAIARTEESGGYATFPVLETLFHIEELGRKTEVILPLESISDIIKSPSKPIIRRYRDYRDAPVTWNYMWTILTTEFSDNSSTISRVNSLSRRELRFLQKVAFVFSRRDFIVALEATHYALLSAGKFRKKGDAGDEEPDVHYIEHLIVAVLLAIALGADFLTLLAVLMHDNLEEAPEFWDIDRVEQWLGPLSLAVKAMTKDREAEKMMTVDEKKNAQRIKIRDLFESNRGLGRFALQCSYFNQLSILLEDTRKAERRINGTGHPPGELIARLADHLDFFEEYAQTKGSGIHPYWCSLFQKNVQTYYEVSMRNLTPQPDFSNAELIKFRLRPAAMGTPYDIHQ